ncbi:hypothetical protein pdam_00022772 [Pocillopora damicornis]|uniref:GIY-YIG domain-containing protein n=1 Tax=Pocillopora damicornis TaxID=46731 RepID=A0A3M6UN66_POCDA|nr:hypothetical protein pdam_00022772 [Pocillopora damicornis]
MFGVKNPIPRGRRTCEVHKFLCADCNACYVGETSRHLFTRLREHLSDDLFPRESPRGITSLFSGNVTQWKDDSPPPDENHYPLQHRLIGNHWRNSTGFKNSEVVNASFFSSVVKVSR